MNTQSHEPRLELLYGEVILEQTLPERPRVSRIMIRQQK